jgi:hypothetical protein
VVGSHFNRKTKPSGNATGKTCPKEGYVKHQSIVCFIKALLALAALSVCSTELAAQAPATQKDKAKPKPCFGPGAGPEFTLSFDGEYAKDYMNVGLSFTTDSKVPEGQKDLLTAQFDTERSAPTAPASGVFKVSVRVPINAISGYYALFNFNASTQTFGVLYKAGVDFTAPAKFEVCNPNPFKKATVKVTENP